MASHDRGSTAAIMYSVEVPGTAISGVCGASRRAPGYERQLTLNGCATLFEVFQRSALLHPDRPCAGHRPIVNTATGEVGDYVWETYDSVYARALAFGTGLAAHALCPAGSDGLRCLGFFAKNRAEWMVGEMGCYARGVVPVPLYDTLGAEAFVHAVNLTGLASVACSQAELATVATSASQCPRLRTVLLMGRADNASVSAVRAAGLTMLTFAEVEARGAAPMASSLSSSHGDGVAGGDSAAPDASAAVTTAAAAAAATAATPPAPNDVAFFCFTSGTTGVPKGAVITHQNMIASAAACRSMGLVMRSDDVHLSYLPLPHVFERLVQLQVLAAGGSIGYYQGDTLKILEDLAALRPTIFPSVPRLLNRVHDKIIAGAAEAGGVKAWLFRTALASKIAGLRNGHLRHGLWDRLVFGPLKARLGFDRLRLMATGSAPLASHVMDFLRAAFGVPVYEGYGQTESSALITLTRADDYSTGHVGIPVAACEVMLEDVPEMGYRSTDVVHGGNSVGGGGGGGGEDGGAGGGGGDDASLGGEPCMGRGEICFRGANVFREYYGSPQKTAETVDARSWCHTGDIGLWTPEGKLKIIDRKKNIFKLSQGEYVAAEKVEGVVSRAPLVAQAFIYGDSLRSNLVAVAVPEPETLEPWLKKQGMPANTTMEAACETKSLQKAVLAQMQDECGRAGLRGFETPRAVFLSPEPFSVDNGLLTPTFKLKRPAAKVAFQSAIGHLYAQLPAPTRSKL